MRDRARPCLVCATPSDRVVCLACCATLPVPGDFVAEQIAATVDDRLDHALIDRWGRPHRLAATTTVGRAADVGVVLMHGLVSRRHSVIARADDGGWSVADAGSSNGTFVNDRPIATATPVVPGDRVRIGGIGFFFVKDDGTLLDEVASSPTVPPDALRVPAHTPPRVEAIASEPPVTSPLLPLAALRLTGAPSSGGGYLAVDSRQVQLTDTQFELLATLSQRLRDEASVHALVRGFVTTGQLIADLPWHCPDPGENHLKQLVRRTRLAVLSVGLADLIESRRGFGYRLRCAA